MFAMSVNDVPGWLVLMLPSAIGVPVAATPGLLPHCDVLTVPVPAELDVAGVVEVLAGVPLLELLLHPAAAMTMAAAMTIFLRADGAWVSLLIIPLRRDRAAGTRSPRGRDCSVRPLTGASLCAALAFLLAFRVLP